MLRRFWNDLEQYLQNGLSFVTGSIVIEPLSKRQGNLKKLELECTSYCYHVQEFSILLCSIEDLHILCGDVSLPIKYIRTK